MLSCRGVGPEERVMRGVSFSDQNSAFAELQFPDRTFVGVDRCCQSDRNAIVKSRSFLRTGHRYVNAPVARNISGHLPDRASVVRFVFFAFRNTGGNAMKRNCRVGVISDWPAGPITHHRPVKVVGLEPVAIGKSESAKMGGVLPVMIAAEVMADFVGQHAVAGQVTLVDGAETVFGTARKRGEALVIECPRSYDEGDEVRFVLVSPGMNLVQITILQLFQALQVEGNIAGLYVIDLSQMDQS